MTRRAVLRIALLLCAAAVVAGCGKKGRPKPPDPETSKFPRQYPKPE